MNTLTHHSISIIAVAATLLPLLSFFVSLLFPAKTGKSGVVAITNIGASLVLSVLVFTAVWNRQVVHEQVEWFTIGTFTLKVGVLLNNMSVMMMVLVSGVALLVHIYSTRYMHGDAYLHRYWAYLGLFCFAMLGLVIADNLLLMYMAWELVGFSSYLLIGFWFTREAAVLANRKAFIMNRIGDIGFLIGIMLVFTQFGTLDLFSLFSHGGLVDAAAISQGSWISASHSMPSVWLTVAGLAFFLGAVAKSAQFPLHTWLPDAMEGPTSVSSLIHAATMVAAGVFLLARIFPLFNDTVLLVVAIIGGFTAFMAATIALVQNDIKRILAFSTISQLGFMMVAIGIGAVSTALFHLVTHAFFKCLLFLSAGAVIHELAHVRDKYQLQFDTQDIRLMGGLRKLMPLTFAAMLIASLALIGLPLTSGYLSKDGILIHSFEWAESRGFLFKLIPYSALLTSWLTAFYISRLIFKVFFGTLRLSLPVKPEASVHEAPPAMKYVLLALACFCLFPLFSLNPLMFEGSWLLKGFPEPDQLTRVNSYHTIIPALVNLVALVLIYFAYLWYGRGERTLPGRNKALTAFCYNQWYLDRFYSATVVRGFSGLSKASYWIDRQIVDRIVNGAGEAGVLFARLARWSDRVVVDGFVNALAYLAGQAGQFFRHFQTGRLQHYLVTMLLLVLAFFLYIFYSGTI